MKDYNEALKTNAKAIDDLAMSLTDNLEDYHTGIRQDVLKTMKQLHMLLRETAYLMQERDFAMGVNAQVMQVSDTQPCVLCNDHYPVASEYAKGLRYEPVPGKGYVFLCWECCIALKKVLDAQVNSFTYNFLFGLGKDVKKLREEVIEETPYITMDKEKQK